MKEGSLVVVKKLPPISPVVKAWVEWLPVDDENTIYTIRELLEENGIPLARLEEGVIGINPINSLELAIELYILKEVQPPEEVSISTLMEEVSKRELFSV